MNMLSKKDSESKRQESLDERLFRGSSGEWGRRFPFLGEDLPGEGWERLASAAAIPAAPLPLQNFIYMIAIRGAVVLAIARFYNYMVTLAWMKLPRIKASGARTGGRRIGIDLSRPPAHR
jgi:hypothetical protein